MTQIAEHAVQCSYPSCNNRTKSPSGMCHIHEGKPLPGPEQVEVDRNLGVPKMQALSDMVADNTLLPNGMRERPEQTDCRLKIMHELYENGEDRVQLRMACGMGKTITQQKTLKDINDKLLDEEDRNGLYLVTAPSIQLAKQLRSDYEQKHVLDADENTPCRVLSVHQDSSDLKGFGSKDAIEKHNALIRKFMEEADDSDAPSVIFAVTSEDSLEKIAEQQKNGPQFDAVVFDEAHNLTRSEDNKKAGYTRVFFNEDPKSIKANKRIFASASQKGSESVAATFNRFGGKSDKEGYLEDMNLVDKKGKNPNRVVGQEQTEMFGKVIGAEYTYRYAVEHGHLVPPKVSAQEVFIQTQPGRIPHRTNTFVSPDGSSVNRSKKYPEAADDQITLGEYTSLVSTAESLANPSIDNGGVPRNVLSFTNEVAEAKTISDPEKWRTFVMGRARSLDPGIQTEEDANNVLDNRSYYDDNPNRIKAAMLVKTANHSRLTYSASNLPRQQREAAEKWFPKDKAYDSSDCTCGRHGGYCACHRVVANVDMFSEGIDIPSVDTVVLNRSNRTTEANVFQAVGRSSRKWTAPIVENGVETGSFTKSEGRIVIPETYANPTGTDEFKQTDLSLSSKNYSQINRVWRDSGNQPWRQNLQEDIMIDRNGYQMPCDDYIRSYTGFQYGKFEDDPAIRNDQDMNATYHIYNSIREKARERYNRNMPDTKADGFGTLSIDMQHDLTMRELGASSDGRSPKTLDTIKAYYNRRPEEFPSYYQYDAAKTYHDYIDKMKTTRGPIEQGENMTAVEAPSKSIDGFFKRLGKRARNR